MEVMRKDLNDARDLHGQAESAAAVWKASGTGPGVHMNGDMGMYSDPIWQGLGMQLSPVYQTSP